MFSTKHRENVFYFPRRMKKLSFHEASHDSSGWIKIQSGLVWTRVECLTPPLDSGEKFESPRVGTDRYKANREGTLEGSYMSEHKTCDSHNFLWLRSLARCHFANEIERRLMSLMRELCWRMYLSPYLDPYGT